MTRRGVIYLVGLGPGGRSQMTAEALEALRRAEVVVGYRGYVALVEDLVRDKELHALELTQETERAAIAVARGRAGRTVAVISSGDAGIYGMAALVFETVRRQSRSAPACDVVVVPGVSAVLAAAALLGAPLANDFAVVSLSDRLTPWARIEHRLQAAAAADFALALLNPKSAGRTAPYQRAQSLLRSVLAADTPVGIVRNAYRPEPSVAVTTLAEMDRPEVDMFTTVIVGNSTSRRFGGWIVTPRGYPAERPAEDPVC